MASQIREQYPFAEIRFGMANTGLETPATMMFARNVDRYLQLDMGLVEAVVHAGRKASTHRLVDFGTASMHGEPMEAVIAKYGIPTQGHPHCTRETKTNPLRSWLADTGWNPGTYRIALGIRADETDRINVEARNSIQFLYPLAERGMTLEDVHEIAAEWPFKLDQPAHEGNCKDCHKKSELKTVINIKNHPDWFDFAQRMHRLAYVLFYGPIEGASNVLHSCDRPSCLNPMHLRIGTQKDNSADMMKRGRQNRTPTFYEKVRQ